MTFANLIVLITIDRARFIATFRVLDFPLRLLLVPFLLILGIITIGVPREKLAVLINNHVTIKLAPNQNTKHSDK